MARDGSIELSPAYGVNPGTGICFLCNKACGVILYGRLRRRKAVEMFGEDITRRLEGSDKDLEAPREMVASPVPCTDCAKLMEQGIVLISVLDGETGRNPYRTGGWCCVREEAVRRAIVNSEVLAHVLKARMAFIEDATWDQWGLPREPKAS